MNIEPDSYDQTDEPTQAQKRQALMATIHSFTPMDIQRTNSLAKQINDSNRAKFGLPPIIEPGRQKSFALMALPERLEAIYNLLCAIESHLGIATPPPSDAERPAEPPTDPFTIATRDVSA